MSKKTFNPNDWKTQNNNTAIPHTPAVAITLAVSQNTDNDIEEIVNRIESAAIDIAPNYADWRDLGFALADALGESGRHYYHRLSRFYSGYTETETNKQFDNCLKAHGHGITIKTLYHLAKSAGVDISIMRENPQVHHDDKKAHPLKIEETAETGIALPTFPTEVYVNQPPLLRLVAQKATSDEDKDLLLLGSLVAVSACLPNIYGIYAEREVFPNLFLFVTAQASAGKGRLTLCRKLVEPIHRSLREQGKAEYEDYQRKLTEYAAAKNKADAERPQEPPLKMLIIPANNSATGLFQILNDNKGVGLIFETEGDTLAQTFKSEYGNYSDGFRKAFHHETISYNRRKDREFVELAMPRLSALLSGTPKQVSTLIPSAENGLFSRFMFYYMNIRPEWKNVFAGNSDQTLDHYFGNLGNQFYDLYNYLQRLQEPLRFCLTAKQQQDFNNYFSQAQNQYLCLCGLDYLATVRRLGLTTFRIAMILTALRIMDTGEMNSPLVCADTDFSAALAMVKVLVQHAAQVYQQLPIEAATPVQPNQRQLFLDALPAEFSRQDYLAAAKQLNIPDKTAEKHIARFVQSGLVNHFAQNKYRKPTST